VLGMGESPVYLAGAFLKADSGAVSCCPCLQGRSGTCKVAFSPSRPACSPELVGDPSQAL